MNNGMYERWLIVPVIERKPAPELPVSKFPDVPYGFLYDRIYILDNVALIRTGAFYQQLVEISEKEENTVLPHHSHTSKKLEAKHAQVIHNLKKGDKALPSITDGGSILDVLEELASSYGYIFEP